MTAIDSFKLYKEIVEGTTTFKNWAKSNAGDKSRWASYSNAIISGKTPSPPSMTTGFGKSLIQVGVIAMQNISATGGFGVSAFGQGAFGE